VSSKLTPTALSAFLESGQIQWNKFGDLKIAIDKACAPCSHSSSMRPITSPLYGSIPNYTREPKIKREALIKLKLHLAMARFRTGFRAVFRHDHPRPTNWKKYLKQELVIYQLID